MSVNIPRTFVFSDGFTYTPAMLESELSNIIQIINNANAGLATWDNVKVTVLTATSAPTLSSLTASRAVVTDANKALASSAVTSATLAFLDATSSVQTQINGKLSTTGGTMSGAIAMGSNKITGLANGTTTGDAVTFGQLPAASVVVQRVTATNTTAANPGVSQTYIDSNLSASITPASSSNKIRVSVYHFVKCNANGSASQCGPKFKIFRGASVIKETFAPLSIAGSTGLTVEGSYVDTVLDSPATTSSTTYKTQVANYAGAGLVNTAAEGNTEAIVLEEVTQ